MMGARLQQANAPIRHVITSYQHALAWTQDRLCLANACALTCDTHMKLSTPCMCTHIVSFLVRPDDEVLLRLGDDEGRLVVEQTVGDAAIDHTVLGPDLRASRACVMQHGLRGIGSSRAKSGMGAACMLGERGKEYHKAA